MDNTTQMLLGMAMIMIIAGISSVVFTKLRFPAVIGYLAAGMVLGPRGLGSVFQIDMNIVNFLADLGIVLLMFSIGLEFNFTKLRRIGGFAMLAGTIEVLITLTIGYSLGSALGYPFVESVFLGAIMSISSTAVILSVLGGMGKLKDDFAQPMIGILIVEDIAAVVLLTLTSPLLSGQVPQLSDAIDILIVIALFVAFSLVLGVALIPRLVDRVARGYSSETLMLVALGLGFSMALVAAAIGLSVAIGAFVMGVILGHADSCCRIEEKVRPIKEMFLAVFFVSIGMLIQPNLVILNIIPAIIIALVFIAAKTFSVTFAGYIANLPARTLFLLGASVVAMGEFSFVIAKQGVAAGAVTDAFYSAVVGAALITMVLLPISAKNGGRAFDGLAKRAPKRFLSTMGAIEAVRAEVRGRLRASAEWRWQLRREFFWIFIDIVIVVIIVFLALVLKGFGIVLDPIAQTLGVGSSVLALVVTIALSLPVVASMGTKLRNVVRVMAASILDTHGHQVMMDSFAYRVLRKLIRLFVILILLLAVLPFAAVFVDLRPGLALIFIIIGVVFGYLLWDFFHSTYAKMQQALTTNILETNEEAGKGR